MQHPAIPAIGMGHDATALLMISSGQGGGDNYRKGCMVIDYYAYRMGPPRYKLVYKPL